MNDGSNTLHGIPARQADLNPGAPAIVWRGVTTDYQTLYGRVRRLAKRLCGCGKPGDRIAVLAWNCPEFLELIYAVAASGRILVPLNVRLAPRELIFQLRSAGVSALFGDGKLLAEVIDQPDLPQHIHTIPLGEEFEHWLAQGSEGDLPDTDADDPAWILYTSGSTGRPKGAVLTHQSLMAGLESAALGRPVLPGDIYLYPFPLFHIAAHNVLLQHQHGACVVLTRSFDPVSTLAACRQLQVSTMSLAPTMISMLLDHPDFDPKALSSVRTIGYGASAMPETLLRRLLRDTQLGLCQSYGMTELAGSVAFLTVADHQRAAADRPELLRSVGKPLSTASIRLVSPSGKPCAPGQSGEILVKARQQMQGYWQDPDATAAALQNNWLHTGDIGRFDEEGYLYIIDRKKDMIVTGGENVASREVEEVIRGHTAVRDCAVIGLPDPQWGEVVCAALHLATDASDKELSNFCRRHIAAYKTPKKWFRVNGLPVNAGGKIDKVSLRASLSNQ